MLDKQKQSFYIDQKVELVIPDEDRKCFDTGVTVLASNYHHTRVAFVLFDITAFDELSTSDQLAFKKFSENYRQFMTTYNEAQAALKKKFKTEELKTGMIGTVVGVEVHRCKSYAGMLPASTISEECYVHIPDMGCYYIDSIYLRHVESG